MIVGEGASAQLYEPMYSKPFGTMCPSVPRSPGGGTVSRGCLVRSRNFHRWRRILRGVESLVGRLLIAGSHVRCAVGADMEGKVKVRITHGRVYQTCSLGPGPVHENSQTSKRKTDSSGWMSRRLSCMFMARKHLWNFGLQPAVVGAPSGCCRVLGGEYCAKKTNERGGDVINRM